MDPSSGALIRWDVLMSEVVLYTSQTLITIMVIIKINVYVALIEMASLFSGVH